MSQVFLVFSLVAPLDRDKRLLGIGLWCLPGPRFTLGRLHRLRRLNSAGLLGSPLFNSLLGSPLFASLLGNPSLLGCHWPHFTSLALQLPLPRAGLTTNNAKKNGPLLLSHDYTRASKTGS